MEFPVSRFYFVLIWNVFIFSVIYFFCSMFSFGVYETDVIVVIFGFIAILNLIAFPFGAIGAMMNYPSLLLIFAIISAFWCTTTILYCALYIWLVDCNFKYFPIHHSILFVYFLLEFSSIIMCSIMILSSLTKVEEFKLKT